MFRREHLPFAIGSFVMLLLVLAALGILAIYSRSVAPPPTLETSSTPR
jgi:hypothetical protein